MKVKGYGKRQELSSRYTCLVRPASCLIPSSMLGILRLPQVPFTTIPSLLCLFSFCLSLKVLLKYPLKRSLPKSQLIT
ncbi:rCG24992, partial [Rattus norvegicus]